MYKWGKTNKKDNAAAISYQQIQQEKLNIFLQS